MSFTATGYERRELEEVISSIEADLISVLPSVNTTPQSYIYQLIKVIAMREWALEGEFEDAFANMTYLAAVGDFLDQHGINAGIFRKSNVYAEGILQITGSVGLDAPAGTTFATAQGTEFVTSEAALLDTTITMTRQSDLTDGIPYPYSNVSAITAVNTQVDGGGTAYTSPTDYTYDDGVITWVSGKGPVTGATYYIWPSGDYTVSVECIASEPGSGGNVGAETVTVNTDAISNLTSVTNEGIITGGLDVESDDDLRTRLANASNAQFGLNSIRSKALGVEGVRACNVTQDASVDQTSVSNWDLVTGLTQSTSGVAVGAQHLWSQTWVPSQETVAINSVTFNGKAVGSPDPFTLGVSIHSSGVSFSSGMETAVVTNTFSVDDLDQSLRNDFQDMRIDLYYGDLDYTRTYRFDIWCSGQANDKHWDFKTTTGYEPVADAYRGALWVDGIPDYTNDLVFKTHYGGASYTIKAALEQNADWETVQDSIEDLLDNVDDEGYSPICIQYNIQQATEVYINVDAVVYVEDGSNFTAIATDIESNIENYLKALDPGDNVIYSRIAYQISRADGVTKVTNVRVKRDDQDWITRSDESDINITSDEVAILDTGAYGPGVSLSEG